jgi:ABC-type multidrug transport system ATPase subunit
MACIEARGLRKQFGTTMALDGIDLHVEEGRILGLIGPNGAGKTTALNAILGLLPYQGELNVIGRDPWTQRDEPTLGLDILYRKQFYDSLLNDYFDRSRTIVVTTHQVEEIQHVITDLMFINRGRVVLSYSMDEIESRFLELMVHPNQIDAARALKPIDERQVIGGSILMFAGADRQQVAPLGEARTPGIADLFVAVIANQDKQAQGEAR